jgi:transglutaminase-like putative cysteine protease
MDRRDFVRLSGTLAAAYALPGVVGRAIAQSTSPGWRTFEVTTRVEVLKPVGVTRIWLSTPLTADTGYQRALGNWWQAEGGKSAQSVDPAYGTGMIWAEIAAGTRPVLTLTSRFATRDVAVDLTTKSDAPAEDPEVLARSTAPTELMPTDGIVKATSAAIVRGVSDEVEKARAIYEWIVENTHRDPKVRGCGIGNVKAMLESKDLGGKCADLNALFVALARAEGIPARDVYGVRVAPSALGYTSLGRAGGDVTKAQHCRAEFYSRAHGWVPVDPADVRKVILEEGGGKAPDDPLVLAARRRLFGSTPRTTSRCRARPAARSASSCTPRPKRPTAGSTASMPMPSNTRSALRRSRRADGPHRGVSRSEAGDRRLEPCRAPGRPVPPAQVVLNAVRIAHRCV